MIVLLIFLFASLLLGSFHVGGVSIRILSTIAMIGYLLIYKKGTYLFKIKSRPLVIYSVFLVITFIAKFLSDFFLGMDEIGPFNRALLAYFLVCYVAFISIDRIVYNESSVRNILILLCGICFLNDIVTYLQYSGNELGIGLGMMFSTTEGDYLMNIAENLNRLDEIRAAMSGIFGHGATNGYMTSTLGILSLYFFVGNGKRFWMLGALLYIVSLVGAFCCQERAGFGLLLLFSMLTFWKFSSRLLKFSIPAIIVIGSIAYYDHFVDLFSSLDIGRYAELTAFDDSRKRLINNSIQFISNHFLLGGDVLYRELYGLPPHNVFFHAIIYSGIFGGIVVLYLTAYMLYDAYKTISNSKSGTLSYFFACALTIYLLNGFLHSSSLITGDVMIWITYACMLRSNQIIKTSSLSLPEKTVTGFLGRHNQSSIYNSSAKL